MSTRPRTLSRRLVLRTAATSLGAAALTAATSGCSTTDRTDPTPIHDPTSRLSSQDADRKVLLAYFSRAGENYYYGGRTDLAVGNTQVLAGMISALIGCDLHRIDAADPYPADYMATVARNVREQNANARPALAHPVPTIDQYDTVLLASGIWNVRAPRIMTTFTESLDLTGRAIHPVTTHAMSGLGTTERDYARSCPGAVIGEGLAVRGEEVRQAGPDIESWLRRTGLIHT
ncbi:flavodoxin [Raineyella fluvialis]|uniref:Flavodoxin-like domain-containing protein n=1 Tax=Raineyella fluvialis TaxID=2662261 RepID=A0A5Q2FEU8_9ACTN|nr:flavodoxin [Raineyella fluvialis]QGF23245.1 hypothetical protein Rai3103_05730 [Raineyella fluvialis]